MNRSNALTLDFCATLEPFFADLFGGGVGYVALSFGKVPNKAVFYKWPVQKAEMLAEAERRSGQGENVFYCPALLQTTDTSPRGGLDAKYCQSVEPFPCLWVDVDLTDDDGNPKNVDHTLLHRLARRGAWRVRSGRQGNEHVYFPLVEAVDLATFERLNTDLKNALGADHAQSRVKWLRLPTFLSYKPVLPHPREVTIFSAPTKRWDADELASLITPQRSRSTSPGQRQGTRTRSAQSSTEARVRRLLSKHASDTPRT